MDSELSELGWPWLPNHRPGDTAGLHKRHVGKGHRNPGLSSLGMKTQQQHPDLRTGIRWDRRTQFVVTDAERVVCAPVRVCTRDAGRLMARNDFIAYFLSIRVGSMLPLESYLCPSAIKEPNGFGPPLLELLLSFQMSLTVASHHLL